MSEIINVFLLSRWHFLPEKNGDTDYMGFPLHLVKVEKEATFLGEKVNLCPHTRIEGPLEICDYL